MALAAQEMQHKPYDDVLQVLSNNANSAEAKIRLLERRMVGDPLLGASPGPSLKPTRISFEAQQVFGNAAASNASYQSAPTSVLTPRQLLAHHSDGEHSTSQGFGLVAHVPQQPPEPPPKKRRFAAVDGASAPPYVTGAHPLPSPPSAMMVPSSNRVTLNSRAGGSSSQQQATAAAGPRGRSTSPPNNDPKAEANEPGTDRPQRALSAAARTPVTGARKQRNTINHYFLPDQGNSRGATTTAPAPAGPNNLQHHSAHAPDASSRPPINAAASTTSGAPIGHHDGGAKSDFAAVVEQGLRAENSDLRQQLQALQQQLRHKQVELGQAIGRAEKERDEAVRQKDEAMQQILEKNAQRLEELQQQHQQDREAAAGKESCMRGWLSKLLRGLAVIEKEAAGYRLRVDAARLGGLGVQRTGPMGMQEVWEEGQAFLDLAQRQRDLTTTRDTIEAARKAMRKRLPPPEHPLSQSTQDSGRSTTAASGTSEYITPDEYVAHDEVFKARIAALRREEEAVNRERERLEVSKLRHIRVLKRLRDEAGSRFSCHPVLHDRYLLLNLLGRGGFSEVYKAFDLTGLREVAVKVHQLNSQWSEAKKQSYVKHATREYYIHRDLQHPRVVALLDLFEIDNNTFATVLELCAGGDLDSHLMEHQVLPEKEAKAIAAQTFAGLAYLNSRRIIHYDLKPANILFDGLGEVKITDFGLSKKVEEGQTHGMELTSQGAGTYWYLPPECFVLGQGPPIISNKVDVWSVGVMLYQMLFGRRPFGEGLSQDQILRESVMLNARAVTFPAKPAVSQDAKDFMTKCLAYRQQDRLDVETAAAHPYLALKRARPAKD